MRVHQSLGAIAGIGATMMLVSTAQGVFHTTEAAFTAAIQAGFYLEEFPGFTNAQIPSPWPAPGANGFGFNATSPGGLWGCPSGLSTNNAADPIVINFVGNPVTAVGGRIFATDIGCNAVATSTITVNLSNGDTHVLMNPAATNFLGWTGPTPITSITITSAAAPIAWPTLDHFYVGTAGGGAPCPANVVNAGTSANRVDVDDLLAVIGGWGPCPAPPAPCPANIVNTGTSVNRVDVDDLLAVIGQWGPCP
jgi:hypothetical protein